jgi:hypothetical protein
MTVNGVSIFFVYMSHDKALAEVLLKQLMMKLL